MYAFATEEQARQLVTQMLFARTGIRPLHGFKEGELRVEDDALRQVCGVVQAVEHLVCRRHWGTVIRVIRVRYRIEKHSLATAVCARDVQVFGSGQDKNLGKILDLKQIINFIWLCFT